MVKYYDIVIIGGSAGGLSCLISSARLYKDKSKLVIKKEVETPIPCALPYIYGEIGTCKKNVIPNGMVEKMGADLLFDEVEFIDKENKVLKLKNSEEVKYDKLVISTGSIPFKPPIKNIDSDGVFFIYKNVEISDNLADKIKHSNNIVVVGGGYIGVEFSEQIKEISPEKNVTIIEGLNRCLAMTFDEEFSNEVEDKLRYVGINIVKEKYVEEVIGSNGVERIKLNDGSFIDADLVIVGVGAKANSVLADKSGLKLSERGDLIVDRFQKTSDKHIFAAGDVCESFSFFTHKPLSIKLASVATMQGRIVAENLFENHFPSVGVIGVYSSKVHDKVYSGAGLTESNAKREGFGFVVGNVKVINRHPDSLSGAKEITMKLIFNKKNKVLIGGQVSGPNEVGSIINQIALAIENKMTAYDLLFLQPATHPKVSVSPIKFHLIAAAENALSKF